MKGGPAWSSRFSSGNQKTFGGGGWTRVGAVTRAGVHPTLGSLGVEPASGWRRLLVGGVCGRRGANWLAYGDQEVELILGCVRWGPEFGRSWVRGTSAPGSPRLRHSLRMLRNFLVRHLISGWVGPRSGFDSAHPAGLDTDPLCVCVCVCVRACV